MRKNKRQKNHAVKPRAFLLPGDAVPSDLNNSSGHSTFVIGISDKEQLLLPVDNQWEVVKSTEKEILNANKHYAWIQYIARRKTKRQEELEIFRKKEEKERKMPQADAASVHQQGTYTPTSSSSHQSRNSSNDGVNPNTYSAPKKRRRTLSSGDDQPQFYDDYFQPSGNRPENKNKPVVTPPAHVDSKEESEGNTATTKLLGKLNKHGNGSDSLKEVSLSYINAKLLNKWRKGTSSPVHLMYGFDNGKLRVKGVLVELFDHFIDFKKFNALDVIAQIETGDIPEISPKDYQNILNSIRNREGIQVANDATPAQIIQSFKGLSDDAKQRISQSIIGRLNITDLSEDLKVDEKLLVCLKTLHLASSQEERHRLFKDFMGSTYLRFLMQEDDLHKGNRGTDLNFDTLEETKDEEIDFDMAAQKTRYTEGPSKTRQSQLALGNSKLNLTDKNNVNYWKLPSAGFSPATGNLYERRRLAMSNSLAITPNDGRYTKKEATRYNELCNKAEYKKLIDEARIECSEVFLTTSVQETYQELQNLSKEELFARGIRLNQAEITKFNMQLCQFFSDQQAKLSSLLQDSTSKTHELVSNMEDGVDRQKQITDKYRTNLRHERNAAQKEVCQLYSKNPAVTTAFEQKEYQEDDKALEMQVRTSLDNGSITKEDLDAAKASLTSTNPGAATRIQTYLQKKDDNAFLDQKEAKGAIADDANTNQAIAKAIAKAASPVSAHRIEHTFKELLHKMSEDFSFEGLNDKKSRFLELFKGQFVEKCTTSAQLRKLTDAWRTDVAYSDNLVTAVQDVSLIGRMSKRSVYNFHTSTYVSQRDLLLMQALSCQQNATTEAEKKAFAKIIGDLKQFGGFRFSSSRYPVPLLDRIRLNLRYSFTADYNELTLSSYFNSMKKSYGTIPGVILGIIQFLPKVVENFMMACKEALREFKRIARDAKWLSNLYQGSNLFFEGIGIAASWLTVDVIDNLFGFLWQSITEFGHYKTYGTNSKTQKFLKAASFIIGAATFYINIPLEFVDYFIDCFVDSDFFTRPFDPSVDTKNYHPAARFFYHVGSAFFGGINMIIPIVIYALANFFIHCVINPFKSEPMKGVELKSLRALSLLAIVDKIETVAVLGTRLAVRGVLEGIPAFIKAIPTIVKYTLIAIPTALQYTFDLLRAIVRRVASPYQAWKDSQVWINTHMTNNLASIPALRAGLVGGTLEVQNLTDTPPTWRSNWINTVAHVANTTMSVVCIAGAIVAAPFLLKLAGASVVSVALIKALGFLAKGATFMANLIGIKGAAAAVAGVSATAATPLALTASAAGTVGIINKLKPIEKNEILAKGRSDARAKHRDHKASAADDESRFNQLDAEIGELDQGDDSQSTGQGRLSDTQQPLTSAIAANSIFAKPAVTTDSQPTQQADLTAQV